MSIVKKGEKTKKIRQLDPTFGSVMIRQRWIMKTERQPERYINDIEVNEENRAIFTLLSDPEVDAHSKVLQYQSRWPLRSHNEEHHQSQCSWCNVRSLPLRTLSWLSAIPARSNGRKREVRDFYKIRN